MYVYCHILLYAISLTIIYFFCVLFLVGPVKISTMFGNDCITIQTSQYTDIVFILRGDNKMQYPDFAFYTSTQIALFFINVLLTTLYYYWGVNILLEIYQNCSVFKQKFLFSIVSALFLNIFIIYGVALINTKVNNLSRLDAGVFLGYFEIILPFSYLILYILGIYILKLSNYNSIVIMRLLYIYYVCCNVIFKIVGDLIFPRLADIRGWNYLRDIYMLLSGTFMIYIFYRFICYLINKYKLYINFSDNIIIKNIPFELFKNFFICFVTYIVIVGIYFYPNLDIFHLLMIFAVLLLNIGITITKHYTIIYKGQLENKDEHISALTQSIEEYKGIKHDFNNILQTYSGYFAIKDYENLRLYHNKMINTTVSAETQLNLTQRISENPSFISLILNKSKNAQLRNVFFQVSLACSLKDIYIDELDFVRIMSILIDNAIEAAELTKLKHINITSQLKSDNHKLFIVSNDTLEDVNIDNIFVVGFTTKYGHMGQGLPQVRKILNKYGNCSMHVTSHKHLFTVYLEVRPCV